MTIELYEKSDIAYKLYISPSLDQTVNIFIFSPASKS